MNSATRKKAKRQKKQRRNKERALKDRIIDQYDKTYSVRKEAIKNGKARTGVKPKRDTLLNSPKYDTIIWNRDKVVKGRINDKTLRFESKGYNWSRLDKGLDLLVKARVKVVTEPLGLQ